MIVVHHLERSRSQRIVWLLEELGQAYEVKRYARDKRTMLAPRALRSVHPLGKAPVVVDGQTILIESGAIIDTLIDRYGEGKGLRPAPGTPERVAYTTFLHLAEGSLMPPLVTRLIFATMAAKAPRLARPLVRLVTAPVGALYLKPTIERALDFLEAELAKRPWFAGDTFSAADIQMSVPVAMAVERKRGRGDKARPKLADWLARVRARPAYKAAMARIGE